MRTSKVPALKLASAEMQERHSIQKMCNAESPFSDAEREDAALSATQGAQEDAANAPQGKEDMS